MSFKNNLYKYRREKGVSQEELAHLLGVSRQTIYKWENGISQPELTNIQKICDTFFITPNELMGYELDFQYQKPSYRKEIISFLLCLFFVVMCALWLTHDDKNEYGFYVSDFHMVEVERNDKSVTYQVSFVPSISNSDYEYCLIVKDQEGKSKIYPAELNKLICVGLVELNIHEEVIVYTQMKGKNIIFTCPLIKVWNVGEEF